LRLSTFIKENDDDDDDDEKTMYQPCCLLSQMHNELYAFYMGKSD